MNKTLTREILKKVRQVEVRTRRMVDDTLAGSYHSVFKGRGMNFDEVREYVPGDEIRTIDWNVTARTGVPHVKKFTEERELTIMLMIDISGSGSFGSGIQSKREMMAELGSVLAFSAVRNNDKVGLILFSDFVELFIPPAKGRSHILRVIREILFFQPQGKGTDIGEALDFVNRVAKRKCVTFLISDFCLPGDFNDALDHISPKLVITGRHHDLITVMVTDPREHTLPDVGWITLEDAETGEQVILNTADSWTRKAYAGLAEDRSQQFSRTVKKAGIDCLELSTDKPYLHALIRFFGSRKKRLAR
ncbi:MAG: DUF58 domain-containing protein [Desulfobulbus sp.]|nr:MAG: DUF58 domain-containing protein [Desulfobulbus sp.]RUM40945.1 MAG: DUF58 domain-containing protein [Desulfobulbus sp.]